MTRKFSLLGVAILLAIMVGCSGGGSPLIPANPDQDLTLTGSSDQLEKSPASNILWGFWQGILNTEDLTVEFVPVREGSFHLNLSKFLTEGQLGLAAQVNSWDPGTGLLDVDVTLTHPLPDSDFRAFDVRAIFMGMGDTLVSKTDPNLVYADIDGTRILNADGYTRWWNAVEFSTPGFFGYNEDFVVPGFLIPTTTLNPYKYFSDALFPDDPVIPKINLDNRGTFSTTPLPPSLTRNYVIQFPMVGGSPQLGFHLAIDASWAMPTGDSPSPKPVGDFPIEANCGEAFHIEVDAGNSTTWYEDPDNNGGDVILSIEVHDWGASENPDGILGEIESIWLESPTLFDTFYVDPGTVSTGSQTTSGTFQVTVPGVHPAGLGNQEVLVTIRSTSPNTYAPPMQGPEYPESAILAAYTIVEIPISAFQPSFVSITVDSPNGGETWAISSEQTIEWTSTDVETVNIDLSLDGGATYDIPLAEDLPNTGEFTIESVGNWSTELARIKVSTADGEVFDESDADFAIAPSIEIITPDGDEIFLAETSALIRWTASDTIENVAIRISLDSGGSFLNWIVQSAPDTGEYNWQLINPDFVSDFCTIKISDLDDPSVFDVSDSDFSIMPKPDAPITILSPNGGEEYKAGDEVDITWGADPVIQNVSIWMSTNSGMDYTIELAPSTPNDGSFLLVELPESVEGLANRIKISDAQDPFVFDGSDNDFIILPSITVLTPNGGEYWMEGNVFEISWKPSDSIANVMILFSSDSGENYMDVVTLSTPNDGCFTWYIDPAMQEGNHSRIKILDVLPTMIEDESDDDFTIFPENLAPLNVTSPNGGEVWIAGTSKEITWNGDPGISDVSIELSMDGGETWPDVITDSTPNDGSFVWDPIPDTAISDFNRIRISDLYDPSVNDISNASFKIVEIGDAYINILNPMDNQKWKIGCDEIIEWQFNGFIDTVNVKFQLDKVGTFSTVEEDVINSGCYDIWSFDPENIQNLGLWDATRLTGKIRVESSDNPEDIFDEVPVVLPINLGILCEMVQASESGDADNDGIPDDIELFLGTNPDSKDSDIPNPDAFFDNYEIFGQGYFGAYDWIPDLDEDGIIAPLDPDDDGDGINDGHGTDSDLDGIANYLEYYGYTYDWMSGTYYPWDGVNTRDPYFKSDPLQPSTDQDPYPDGMEVSGVFMDVSVKVPGDYPMVPAYPNIVVRLEGYDVTVNEEITYGQGESLEKGSTWTRETSRTTESSSTDESNWEAGIEAGIEYGFPKAVSVEVKGHYNEGGSSSSTSTNSSTATNSIGESIISCSEWNRSTTTNPTNAAKIKLFLKVYNLGTSCASNIIPTLTLKIGGMNIATFEPGNAQINILAPGGIYPSTPGTYWVVDCIDTGTGVTDIILTLDELRALESKCPVSIVMTQMLADVMLMNESGQWESAGDWGEYMARCESVCSNMFLEIGDGNFIHYLVYSDDSPSAPVVTFRDALVWVAGSKTDATDLWITYYDQFGMEETAFLNDWSFCFDGQTLINNGYNPNDLTSMEGANLADFVLNPDSVIVGKIPRGEVDPGGPVVYYAFLDEPNDRVRACAGDYNGIKVAWFHDRYDGWYELDEIITNSGLYTCTIPSSYQWNGTEHLVVECINPAVPITYHDLEKSIYPEIVVPGNPVFDFIGFDWHNRTLRADITVGDPAPEGIEITSVIAYHSAFPGGELTLAKEDIWSGHPNGWITTAIPCEITLNNYEQIMIIAYISPGIYSMKLVTWTNWVHPTLLASGTGYSKADLHSDYWQPGGFNWGVATWNFDSGGFANVPYGPVTTPWHWPPAAETQFTSSGYEVFIRPHEANKPNDPPGAEHNILSWIMYFNVNFVEYTGGKEFDCITKSDCESLNLDLPGYEVICN
ncbi:hypothetical protein KAU08_00485, partial [bacterium]|nr:hypothetical protein [bacterium]